MSDAVHRIAPNRLVRSLAAATATLGLAGGALALALSSGAVAGATPAHPTSVVASGPVSLTTHGTKDNWPYFACVAVFNEGVCIGPPTSS